ncbi:hypothetical protein MMC07_008413, partial [Pseudocyphellaria aurata]|nr:hypothetical protein [Pseudocyphellaria aurata]
VSTAVLFAVCLVSVCARYYIRIGIQKEFALDDAFLAFGTVCLIAAMVTLYINLDCLYLFEAMEYAPSHTNFTPQSIDIIVKYRRLGIASLELTWVAMMAVKFSFLVLFRRLIDRIPPLIRYWRVVVAFNLAVTVYGALVYCLPCPHFSRTKIASCRGQNAMHKGIQFALSHLVLDLFGDLLSTHLYSISIDLESEDKVDSEAHIGL